jgi:predicted AAA+ superfamily ATPase
MAAQLAAVSDWSDVDRRQLVGPLLETWVHGELRKLVSLQVPSPQLSFWKTQSGQEVDFVLERGEEIVGLEVLRSGAVAGQLDLNPVGHNR